MILIQEIILLQSAKSYLCNNHLYSSAIMEKPNIMDINKVRNLHCHPSVAQKPYTLPWKHDEWAWNELEVLEAGSSSWIVSPWYSLIVIMPKKDQPGKIPQNWLCVDHCTVNCLLSLIVKVHFKAQGILSLVPFPKTNYMQCSVVQLFIHH